MACHDLLGPRHCSLEASRERYHEHPCALNGSCLDLRRVAHVRHGRLHGDEPSHCFAIGRHGAKKNVDRLTGSC